MCWTGKRSGGKNVTVNNRFTHPISSPLPSFTCRDQTLGVVVLFGNAGGALPDAPGQWRYGVVESGQLGE
jgi:hypothetical protein